MGNPAKGAAGKTRRPSRQARGRSRVEERWVVRPLREECDRASLPYPSPDSSPEDLQLVDSGAAVVVVSALGAAGDGQEDPVVGSGSRETAEWESSLAERGRVGGEEEVGEAVGSGKEAEIRLGSVGSAARVQNGEGSHAGDSVSEPASSGKVVHGKCSGSSFEADLEEAVGRLEQLSLRGKEPELAEEQRRFNDQRQDDEVMALESIYGDRVVVSVGKNGLRSMFITNSLMISPSQQSFIHQVRKFNAGDLGLRVHTNSSTALKFGICHQSCCLVCYHNSTRVIAPRTSQFILSGWTPRGFPVFVGCWIRSGRNSMEKKLYINGQNGCTVLLFLILGLNMALCWIFAL